MSIGGIPDNEALIRIVESDKKGIFRLNREHEPIRYDTRRIECEIDFSSRVAGEYRSGKDEDVLVQGK